MYENYVFDLYGTLVDIHTDEADKLVWEKLCLFCGYYGALYQPGELEQNYKDIVNQQEGMLKDKLESQALYSHEAYPEIKIEQVFMELFRRKGIEAGMELSVHTGQFFRVLTTEYICLYDKVPKMLAGIKKMGKKIYLLSNAQRIFTEYELNVLNIARYFDGILISSEYGTRKPDLRFFHILFEKYGVDPKKSIMIGNDAANDIAGAARAGMDTFYIHSNISPECTKEPDATYSVMEMDIPYVCKRLGIGLA